MAISKRKRLELLKDVSAAFLQLRKTISSLSDADLMRPNTVGSWSGKDLIGHIAAWEGVYAGVLRDPASNRPTDHEIDAWNESQATLRADWSLDEVQEFFEQTHADLMELLERAPDIDPAEAFGYTRDHYNKHYDDFMACRQKRAR